MSQLLYKYYTEREMLDKHKCCVAAKSGKPYPNFDTARSALSRNDLKGFKVAEINDKNYYLVPPLETKQ